LKIAGYIAGFLGLVLLLILIVHSEFSESIEVLGIAGWQLFWLVPYRALFFVLYALGWRVLLGPYDPARRAGLGYLFWVTTLREAIDRLLPVASVGGSVIAVRLLRWRGLAGAPVAATVVVEILLTLVVSYLFALCGVAILVELGYVSPKLSTLVLGLLAFLPALIAIAVLLRFGSPFRRSQRLLHLLTGANALAADALNLDDEVQATLRRGWGLCVAGALQFAALLSGAFEVWFALTLFGHPVSAGDAVILESLTQAVRLVAFIVPAALGVQEAALVLFGQALGIGSELALAVSIAKRMREVLCALPSLLSWQWLEARQIRLQLRMPS